MSGSAGEPPVGHPPVPKRMGRSHKDYTAALAKLDLDAVKEDLKKLFKFSQDFWPADYGNYGPLFVRLAWHCSGSYRTSDGRGGCDGGRQRFDPERSWADNTNLDKARALLWPIKEKYGLGLSWGDLMILAGTTAVESMGGPILGFCAGRIDDTDGSASYDLGPTPQQEQDKPCPINGQCKTPLGSTTIGLIYLNPEGPMAQPLPHQSAAEVRDSFGRMNMNDSETVALIGGGHAFGKTHGACPAGAGPSPKEDPTNPWPGECGTGKGKDAFTSGFEGPWTTTPTWWGNEYFRNLLAHKWEVHKGPGGHFQWRISNATGDLAKLMRLTTDISLTQDPTGTYQQLVQDFAGDQEKFNHAWKHAWYKLTSRDMGPVTRCMGKDVPPPQPWQHPLPPTPSKLADFAHVKMEVKRTLKSRSSILPPDEFNGEPYYGALYVRLAWQCASTFRQTDYLGGCNGARIRLSPAKFWPANAALDKALLLLKPIKDQFGSGLSWADLIVLAGSVALEEAGGKQIGFCGGRTDAEDGSGWQYLEPKVSGATNSTVALKDFVQGMGLSYREMAALIGGGHSLGKMHPDRSGFQGSWTEDPTRLSNDYFRTLLTETWEKFTTPGGLQQFKAKGKNLYMLNIDLLFMYDAELQSITQEYASDNELFLQDFTTAWTKIVNADRFDGPTANICEKEGAMMMLSATENELVI